MKKLDKVSLIIPVYNAENYIDECLESCVMQTYKNIEIICVNDGSKDNSVEHIEKFMAKHPNIILVNQENSGVAVARNAGINASSGDYIIFVDSDDYISHNMVERLVDELIKTKADAVRCNIDTTVPFLQFSKIKENKVYSGKAYQEQITRQLFEDNNIFCQVFNGIYKKELCGEFPKGFRLGEDVLFNGEYFMKAKSVAMITDSLYYYRDNPTSVTHKPSIKAIINNIEHSNSYYYVKELVKDSDIKEEILEKVALRNYASYMRLMFQIYGITNALTSVKHAQKYYKLYKDVFDKVEYKEVENLVMDYKVRTCVEPFYKRHFLKSYIGYKYTYKRLKKKVECKKKVW